MSIYLYKDNATELYVFKYKGFVFNPKPGSMMLIERESDGFVNLQAVYDNKAFRQNTNGHILNDFVDPELILDDTGTAYGAAASDILAALSDFFVDAPVGGGNNTQIIDMKPGEYLMDILEGITDSSIDKQYTINFYNHSKTINWDTFTEKIHWPEHVHLNFVGKINWWPNTYYQGMEMYMGLLSGNPTDKLFLGFSFDRTNNNWNIKVSGLPENVQNVFFGGLDQSYQIAESYQNLIYNPEDWGEAEFGLVRVNGSKEDDARNDALYKKINGVFVNVTPDFRFVDFSGCNLRLAYFFSANNQSASFSSADNQDVDFSYTNNQGVDFSYANNQGADFSSANNQGASFNNANNQGASFNNATNKYMSFSYANNQGAYFGSANNQGASFNNANNQGAYFGSANNQGASFSNSNNQGAYFGSANNQGASFDNANLKNVFWGEVASIADANFKNADLTGGFNLPERIDTKAKWIAECGAGNVNAQTIWIDGTSILS